MANRRLIVGVSGASGAPVTIELLQQLQTEKDLEVHLICSKWLLRAADVTLKERRPLVLMPRECPLSTLHLRNLTAVSELGAVVVPPVPAWYDHPRSMEDVNRQIAARIVRMLPLGRQLPWEWRGLS